MLSEQACSSRTPPLHPFSLGFTSMVVALGSAEFDSVTEFEAIGYWSIAAQGGVCGRLHLSRRVRAFGIRALWNEFKLRVGKAVAAGLDSTSTSMSSVSYEPTVPPTVVDLAHTLNSFEVAVVGSRVGFAAGLPSDYRIAVRSLFCAVGSYIQCVPDCARQLRYHHHGWATVSHKWSRLSTAQPNDHEHIVYDVPTARSTECWKNGGRCPRNHGTVFSGAYAPVHFPAAVQAEKWEKGWRDRVA